MSKVRHDIFALVINFLRDDWQPKHITLHVFELPTLLDKLWLKS
jgi:hypothetical protein